MAWSPCPLKRFPGARQPDHRLPACSHRFHAIPPRATRVVRFTPTTARETRHVHRTHHFYRLAAVFHRYFAIFRKSALFASLSASSLLYPPIFRLFSRSVLRIREQSLLSVLSTIRLPYRSRKFLVPIRYFAKAPFVYPLPRFLRIFTI